MQTQLSTTIIDINVSNPLEGLIELLSIDSDFGENEEYWRKDTIQLGFKNEAERVAKEIIEQLNTENDLKNNPLSDEEVFDFLIKKVLDSYSGDWGSEDMNGSFFILSNKSLVSEYDISYTQIDGDDYKLFVSWIEY